MRVYRQQNIQSPSIFSSPPQIKQLRSRYVSEYKPRNNADRQKDKIKSNSIKRSLCQLQRSPIQDQKHYTNKYRYRSDNCVLNEEEIFEFHSRSKSFVSKKSLICEKQSTKGKQIKLMFINIKDALKQNQAIIKNTKQNEREAFLALRSNLKQQIYKGQQNRDYFPYKIDPSVEQQIAKSIILNQKTGKCILNPFFSQETVNFTSAVLNKPIKNETNVEQTIAMRSNTENIAKSIQKINRFSNLSKLMCFGTNNCEVDGSYLKKIKSFLDFIFKVNYSNNIYVDLRLSKNQLPKDCRSYKVYVGQGNNSALVESLLKRRFWWSITHNSNQQRIDFYWTQNRIDKFHQKLFHAKKDKKQQRIECANKNLKVSQEQMQNNRRILTQLKCRQVQNYINNDSFFIPFNNFYEPDVITNHLPRNNCIGSKKNLFKSLFNYYIVHLNKNPFEVIPKTYHIHSINSQEYQNFKQQNTKQPQKIWIVKPGQNSNRGKSISLASFQRLDSLFTRQKGQRQANSTFIIQSYINKPFLYNYRKFDIRHYMMLTSVNGIVKAYWYKEGYIRTSSFHFNLQDTDNLFIHLTNDAIQKNGEFYQKYEPANKLSYGQFQRYLQITYPNKQYNFQRDILAKMKEIATDIVKANYLTIDSNRLKNNFQIFGLDFMIDKQFKPWLIEVNYNPCLEVNCHVLERVIPGMLQNSFRLGLDPLYPPPCHYPISKRFYLSDNYLKHLKYQLIFDESALTQPIINDYDFQDENNERQDCYLQEVKESTDIV